MLTYENFALHIYFKLHIAYFSLVAALALASLLRPYLGSIARAIAPAPKTFSKRTPNKEQQHDDDVSEEAGISSVSKY